jgi:dihydrofolate synthase/folylpolyglutamate synthase
MKLGLDNMRALAERLGNPERRLNFIHIAGTNGKGSTAAFTASILQAAGFRVGLYTSPHLLSFGERIQVNGRPMTEEEIADGLTVLQPLLKEVEQRPGGAAPTFFEVVTALTLWHFEREEVQMVVWETGLGGRLDATNIVTPVVSVITSVGMDHTQYLGNEVSQIAAEKAGIIKPGVPVVSSVEGKEAIQVVRAVAEREQAPLTRIGLDVEVENKGLRAGKQWAEIEGQSYGLGLWGAHQVRNAACAYAAVKIVAGDHGEKLVASGAIQKGLAETTWPGRFQVIKGSPLIILDGAHNPAAVGELLATWEAACGRQPYHLIWGVLADKEYEVMARQLQERAAAVTLVKVANERTVDPEQLRSFFPEKQVHVAASLADALTEAKKGTRPVLVTGSLFLVAEALGILQGREMDAMNEVLKAR